MVRFTTMKSEKDTPKGETEKTMEELFFLISINENSQGESINHVTNRKEWQHIVVTARANGWKPMGTILDYEFQYQLEASQCADLTVDKHILIDQYVTDRCGRWKGGYLAPEYQIVVDEDARGLRRALQKASASLDLLIFLSHGAFRIAG